MFDVHQHDVGMNLVWPSSIGDETILSFANEFETSERRMTARAP